MSLWARFERGLGGPRFAWRAAAVALVLALPALGNGLIGDDHFLRSTSLGLNPPELTIATKWDLFRFFSGRPDLHQQWLELGVAPWWAPPDLRIGFWRPVASALHHLDFVLWPNGPALMHAHSLLWLGALVLVCGALFRRFHSAPWIAALATLIFAVDDGHGIPVGWIANRNALTASFFAVLAVLAHDRWRRDGWRPGALLAPLALLTGLLSGEIALGALGGVLAHAWVFEKGARARLVALAPAVVLVVAWRIAYSRLGYGAHGSGLYLDPVHSPLAFVTAVAERLPLLIFAQMGGLTSDLWAFAPRPVALSLVAVALVGCALLVRAMWRLLKGDSVARFYALWLVLAALPGCATFPNDRLLVIASVAGAGLVAQALAAWRLGGAVSKPLALFLVFVHLVAAPLTLPARIYSLRRLRDLSAKSLANVSHDLVGRTLVVVNAPDGLMCVQIIAHGASHGVKLPAHLRCLAVTREPLRVSRSSENQLVLTTRDGFLDGPLDTLFRTAELPWHIGDGAKTRVLPITVTELAANGRPSALRADFGSPLESPEYVLIVWRGQSYVPFVPPPVGESVELPATSMTEVLFDR